MKKAANFKAAVWFLTGMQVHCFLNQNCNWGLDWTNHKLRTNVNMFLLPFPFKWNDAFCPKRCRFEGTVGLLLPLDARSRGRRRFFFLCHRLPLSLKPQKDANLTNGLPPSSWHPPSTLPCPLTGQRYGIFTTLLCL
jgi:hypothetical protein